MNLRPQNQVDTEETTCPDCGRKTVTRRRLRQLEDRTGYARRFDSEGRDQRCYRWKRAGRPGKRPGRPGHPRQQWHRHDEALELHELGLTVFEVARRMDVTESTVEKYLVIARECQAAA